MCEVNEEDGYVDAGIGVAVIRESFTAEGGDGESVLSYAGEDESEQELEG